MKKTVLFLVFALLCLNHIQAVRVKGYYISTTNDTISVTFKRSLGTVFTRRAQYKLKYYDSNNQKKKLTPDMAIEVGYEYKGKVHRMLSRNRAYLPPAFHDEGQIFLELIMDGRLKLFKFKSSEGSFSQNSHTGGVYQLLQFGDEEMYWVVPSYSKKDLINYLSDCPDLVKRIETGIFTQWNIKEVVKYYNNHCTVEAE